MRLLRINFKIGRLVALELEGVAELDSVGM